MYMSVVYQFVAMKSVYDRKGRGVKNSFSLPLSHLRYHFLFNLPYPPFFPPVCSLHSSFKTCATAAGHVSFFVYLRKM